MSDPPRDLTRTMLQAAFVGALVAGTFWILYPFLLPAIWAVTIVVATWPVMLFVQSRLWGKRGLAVTVMTLALLLMLLVPLALGIITIAQNADRIVGWVKQAGIAEVDALLSGVPRPRSPLPRPVQVQEVARRRKGSGYRQRRGAQRRLGEAVRACVKRLGPKQEPHDSYSDEDGDRTPEGQQTALLARALLRPSVFPAQIHASPLEPDVDEVGDALRAQESDDGEEHQSEHESL